jgi:DNA-binding LytR/AlgR family response regulator
MKIHKGFKCVGECLDVMTAIESVNKKKPDFIFLDIEMPDLNGFQLLKYFEIPDLKVIVTTAHRNFAVDGFNHVVFDFITKPIELDRLLQSLNRLKSEILKNRKCNEFDDEIKIDELREKLLYIFVSKHREKASIKMFKKDIYYITKENNLLKVFDEKEVPYYTDGSLKKMIKILPAKDFSFANQSYIFNIQMAECKDGKNIILDNVKNKHIKISSPYRKNFIVKE